MLDRARTQTPDWQHRTDAADDTRVDGWESRVDRGELLKPYLRDDGILLVQGVAVKECILTYRRRDGSTFRELVPESTIVASRMQLAHLPVTLGHPDGPVNDVNVDSLAVGNVTDEVEIGDGGYTRVRMAIRSKRAKDAIQSGTRELSLGYAVKVDATAGNHPTLGAYDGVQVARSHNHLAIVPSARVGPDAAIRFDGESVEIHTEAGTRSGNLSRSGARMNPRLIAIMQSLGISVHRIDSDEAAIDAINDHVREAKLRKDSADRERADALATAERDRDAARTAETAAKAEVTTAKAERDREKARADAAAAELATIRAAEAERADAAERVRIAPLVTKHRIDATKHSSVADLKRAIAQHVMGAAYRADASDDYVAARVDSALEVLATAGTKTSIKAWEQAGQGANANASRADGNRSQPRKSRWDVEFEKARQ